MDRFGRRNVQESENKPLAVASRITEEEENVLKLNRFGSNTSKMLKSLALGNTEVEENTPLCDITKCFGACKEKGCTQRHHLIDSDLKSTPDCPTTGELEFQVINCRNPSLYFVWLRRHFVQDEDGETKCVKTGATDIEERCDELWKHYKLADNRITPTELKLGKLYGVSCSSERGTRRSQLYLRVMITKLPQVDCPELGLVEILCVDTGNINEISPNRLVVLPDKFQNWQALCFNLVLPDLFASIDARKEQFPNGIEIIPQLSKGAVYRGVILVSVQDTVWLTMPSEKNLSTKKLVEWHALFANLVSCKTELGIHLLNSIETQIRKCHPEFPPTNAGVSLVPDDGSIPERVYFESGDTIKFLELDLTRMGGTGSIFSPIRMNIQGCLDPWKVFATPISRENVPPSLYQLEEAISADVNETPVAHIRQQIAQMGPGVAVAVKRHPAFGVDLWRRGFILKDETAEAPGGTRKFRVLLVDHGWTKEKMEEGLQVRPLKRCFVDALPFQVACLKLAHIQPVEGDRNGAGWEHIGMILDVPMSVSVFVFETGVQTPYHNCYAAFALQLKYSHLTADRCIGLQMVRLGHARVTPMYKKTIGDLKDMLRSLPLNDSSEEENDRDDGPTYDDDNIDILDLEDAEIFFTVMLGVPRDEYADALAQECQRANRSTGSRASTSRGFRWGSVFNGS